MAPLVFLLIIATGVLVTRQLWSKKQGQTLARPGHPNLEGLGGTTQPQSRFIGTLVIGSDRCVLECNDTFCDFFRLNHKDVVGRRITTLFRRSLAPHLRRPELLEGRLAHDATAASKLSPLEFALNIPGHTEALKVVHTTAVLEDARLGEARVEYFVNVNELVGHKPSVRLEHPPQPTVIDPTPSDEPAPDDEPPAVHIDPSLCPVSLNGPALSLLSNGGDAKHLLGKPLTSSSGWLGDTSILAEIRKTLRGGGTSQTRRQLSANGPWVNVSIIPTPEGVLLTLKADSDTRPTPREQVQPQKQGDLFASLGPSRPTGSPERPSRPPARRSLANPPEQTEFLFRPSPGLH